MARRLLPSEPPPAPTQQNSATVVGLRDWVAGAVAKAESTKQRTVTDGRINTALVQIAKFSEAKDWSKAGPIHFLALYIYGHELTYGVAPLEIDAAARVYVMFSARNCLDKHFDNDPAQMVKYIDWAWAEAKRKEKWAESTGRHVARLGWRHLFSGYMLTDYMRKLVDKRKPGK